MPKGDIIKVKIHAVEHKGKAVGKLSDGRSVFATRGVPGQIVEAQITKDKPSFALAETLKVFSDAPDAITPQCPWFGRCGGCLWQNVEYSKQLKFKQSIVHDTLSHIAGVTNLDCILPIISSPKQWFYRNKIELSFGEDELGIVNLGFRRKGTWYGVLPIDRCEIFSKEFPSIVSIFRQWLYEQKLDFFDLKKYPEGYLQYLVIRRTDDNSQWMFHLITREGNLPGFISLKEALSNYFGERSYAFFHTINRGGVGYAHHRDTSTQHLHGSDLLLENLGDCQFSISPFSFFQTNSSGAVLLYDVIKSFADVQARQRILDLYCGTGTIGQYIGYNNNIDIVGIESVPSAIENAHMNAKRNGLDMIEYICGDARKILKEYQGKESFDLIVIDPPRSGMAPKALTRALALGARKIIYVSCNVVTFARDIVSIYDQSPYRLSKLQPVDMFPQTPHVEIVGLLEA